MQFLATNLVVFPFGFMDSWRVAVNKWARRSGWRPSQAMSMPSLVATLKIIEEKMQTSAPTSQEVNR
jgi:hypothetical protein